MMKAKKNQVEADGMMNAHLKDAVALCDFISLMVEEVGLMTRAPIFSCLQTLSPITGS